MVHYTFQHKSTITKLPQDVTQYCKNITTLIWHKCENTMIYTIINGTKGVHESQRENSRAGQGARKDSITPRSREYGDITVTYIHRSKIPSHTHTHIYILSISTGKKQSTEARGVLYIPTYENNYKVITG